MEDGALVLEHLEDELLGDDGHHATAAVEMPPPSLPLASKTPSASMCGGRATPGHGSQPLLATWDEETPESSTPIAHRPQK